MSLDNPASLGHPGHVDDPDDVDVDPVRVLPSDAPPPAPTPVVRAGPRERVDGRALARIVVGWIAITLIALIVVLYLLSPVFAQRDQHRLMGSYRETIRQSTLQASGLYGLTLPTQPPATGSPVGIIQIGRLHLQQVVTEGVGPAQTEQGPGHVPGTAGLGQPGNAAVVGRHHAFGGLFSDLSSLRKGDPIVVTTTEGQSLYVVDQVRSLKLVAGQAVSTSPLAQSSGPVAPVKLGSSVHIDDLYGPSVDNRLTLVTSDSAFPWNDSGATVVVATMKTQPFTPSPQQARSTTEDGRSAAGGAFADLVLALLFFSVVAVGAVILYRRSPIRTAYLVSTAPLVVAVILLSVAVSRMLPAWT